jgi:hypothetical protein
MNIDIEKACAGLRALVGKKEYIPDAFIDLMGGDISIKISGIPVYEGPTYCFVGLDLGTVCEIRYLPLYLSPAPPGNWWQIYKSAYEDYQP